MEARIKSNMAIILFRAKVLLAHHQVVDDRTKYLVPVRLKEPHLNDSKSRLLQWLEKNE